MSFFPLTTHVQGLHPESHGIVNNKFYDSVLDKTFNINKNGNSLDPEWWLGEPVSC